MSQPNVKQAVPFFFVKNIQESLHFYVECLGFKKTKEWVVEGRIRWCWLEHGDAALMLQEFSKEALQRKLPEHRLGEGVSIAFICDNALSLYLEFINRGVLASEPFVGNGMWVVNLSDPDGYNIFFESFTNVPEETKYSQWRRAK